MGIARERVTFEKMLVLYCTTHHVEALCTECRDLLSSLERILKNCPYGDNKPLCSKCSSGCLTTEDREKVTKVMRYSGPRMAYRHPALTLLHCIDLLKVEPELRH